MPECLACGRSFEGDRRALVCPDCQREIDERPEPTEEELRKAELQKRAMMNAIRWRKKR